MNFYLYLYHVHGQGQEDISGEKQLYISKQLYMHIH